MIKMIRVDYRLLHGQVAFSWTQMLGADALLLISDTLKNDPLRLQTLSLAKPEGTKVVVKDSNEAIKILKSGITDKYKLFIICETLEIAAKVAEELNIKSINVGNIAFAQDRKQVSKSVFLDDKDIGILKKLIQDNFDVYIQMVPTERKIDAKKILKEV